MIDPAEFRPVILVAAMLLVSLALSAQDFQQVSDQSLTLGQGGNWDAAIATARKGLDSCPRRPGGNQCRALLTYSMGFIEQKRGESSVDPDKAREAFLNARKWYESSLAEDPDNGPALFNLALLLQNSGATSNAILSLKKAIDDDPFRASEYGVKLGDIYAATKDVNSAWTAYDNAAKSAPAAETPRWRLLGLMSRVALTPSKVQSMCKSWETTFRDIAAACYERLINASYKDNGVLAEQSFLSWLTLLSEDERLTEDSLAALPGQWNTSTVEGLQGFLGGSIPPSVPDWWQASRDRRKAFATVMLLEGHRYTSRGPKFVELCWRTGIEAVKGLLDQERGAAMPLTPPVTLNLYQELALLYIRYPDFDPDQRKLKALISEIFEQKGVAIASRNLEAEQRFHTVLGIIFVQQRNWGFDTNSHSAAYQLLRTIAVAEQRYQEQGIYQPLPEIKELQARVYRASGQPEKAYQALWNAALAYMDSDELSQAEEMIAQVPDGAGTDKASLNGILQLRKAATSGSADPALISQYQSLSEKPGIRTEFLKRQQFKILADLVSASSSLADKSTLQHALDAFDLAARQRVPLVGISDLRRWQAVQRIVVTSVGGQAKEGPGPAPGISGNPLKLSLPGHTSLQEVEVPETTVRAAQIARIIGPENVVQMHSHLSYDGRKLVLPAEILNNTQMGEKLKAAGVKVAPK